MKKILLIIATIFVTSINAQIVSFNPKTGDLDMDNVLKDINTKAQNDLNTFKEEVSTKFNITKTKIDDLLKAMAPGDVYMTAQTAEITKKPVETVAETYSKNKDKGWGQIAKELGIKPGSKEFHELKNKTKEHGNQKGKGKSKEKANGKSGEHGKGNGKKK